MVWPAGGFADGGRAPDDHPKRCVAIRRVTKERCQKFACKGATRCYIHGGRREQSLRDRGGVRIHRLPSFYKRVLCPTLAEMVEAQLGVNPSEQVLLNDELALARTMALDAAALYSRAYELPLDNKVRTELLLAAGSAMKDALDFVRTMSESAQRVMMAGKDKFSIHNLQAVVHQITRVAYETFGEDDPRAIEFEQTLREKIALPDAMGTSLSPDQDVTEMDATIPRGDTSHGSQPQDEE